MVLLAQNLGLSFSPAEPKLSRLLSRLGTACWLWFVIFAATAQPVRANAFDDGWQITNGDALVGEAVSFSYVPGRVERFVAASPGETVVFAVQVNNEATNSIGYQQIIADSWGITLSAGGVNASEGGQTVGIFSVSLELQVPDGETGVTISLEGQDLGMWVGYYGPVFYDPSIEVRPAASGAVKVEVYQFDNAPPPLDDLQGRGPRGSGQYRFREKISTRSSPLTLGIPASFLDLGVAFVPPLFKLKK